NGFRYLILPNAIDLGDASRAAEYAAVSVQVRGTSPGQTLNIKGQPILYGLTIPSDAPHSRAAKRFLDFLTSAQTVATLRAAHAAWRVWRLTGISAHRCCSRPSRRPLPRCSGSLVRHHSPISLRDARSADAQSFRRSWICRW